MSGAEQVPDWAIERAVDLLNAGTEKLDRDTSVWFSSDRDDPETGLPQFAAYIAAHEEAPVDPLLIEAREICAQYWERCGNPVARDIARDYRNGIHDEGDERLTPVLVALKRGIELAKTGGAA